MSDIRLVNTKVRELIRTLLAMPVNSVRPANQNAPTGLKTEQFATVLITEIAPTGDYDKRYTNELAPSTNVSETSIGQELFACSLQFFRGDALTKANRLYKLIGMSAGAEFMQANGLGLVRVGAVQNLTGLVDTLWEERSQINLDFHLISLETASLLSYGEFPVYIDKEQQILLTKVFEP
jgi:hypothetical protein